MQEAPQVEIKKFKDLQVEKGSVEEVD